MNLGTRLRLHSTELSVSAFSNHHIGADNRTTALDKITLTRSCKNFVTHGFHETAYSFIGTIAFYHQVRDMVESNAHRSVFQRLMCATEVNRIFTEF